jgi:hypothetical protein
LHEDERRAASGLVRFSNHVRFSNSRTLTNAVQGGFYFRPSGEDLSPVTPERKKPLSGSGFGVWQLENRYSPAASLSTQKDLCPFRKCSKDVLHNKEALHKSMF